jgi:hypothetical protein
LKATEAIYIEPLTSRPPLEFHESNESSRKSKNVEEEIFKALRCATTVKRLEETLRDL